VFDEVLLPMAAEICFASRLEALFSNVLEVASSNLLLFVYCCVLSREWSSIEGGLTFYLDRGILFFFRNASSSSLLLASIDRASCGASVHTFGTTIRVP